MDRGERLGTKFQHAQLRNKSNEMNVENKNQQEKELERGERLGTKCKHAQLGNKLWMTGFIEQSDKL